jgi:nucleolar protein 58
VSKEIQDELGVADAKLGGVIKDKLGISCVADSRVSELLRGIRSQMTSLIEGLDDAQLKAMQLGLGHTLSRYKLKFSPDKVDTMIVQAIGLLDELDKEVNVYAMRTKEWYGWHFPEMAKVVNDNLHYAKIILKMGFRCVGAPLCRAPFAAPRALHPAPTPPPLIPHFPPFQRQRRQHRL